jgi:hypothetical protein
MCSLHKLQKLLFVDYKSKITAKNGEKEFLETPAAVRETAIPQIYALIAAMMLFMLILALSS